ncbi:hypothetical protein FDP41_001855 [Naegleria fowleri]|uniref:Protein kinase domain-containing protein n=1 Tax=Naegleria fowleri TaxID=5763 RepID=A0A6A5BZM0_NAEFO|nr:uncharacterized protein FDP41_001855 [Naegleria fowleri]KAF0978785.1 hypothetical protein FDP41_001855 [Naegleria fowleri]
MSEHSTPSSTTTQNLSSAELELKRLELAFKQKQAEVELEKEKTKQKLAEIKIEEEKRKAEEEKRKAEEEKRKAEEEKTKQKLAEVELEKQRIKRVKLTIQTPNAFSISEFDFYEQHVKNNLTEIVTPTWLGEIGERITVKTKRYGEFNSENNVQQAFMSFITEMARGIEYNAKPYDTSRHVTLGNKRPDVCLIPKNLDIQDVSRVASGFSSILHSIIEVKHTNISNSSAHGQVFFYLTEILRIQKNRREAFGALSTYESIRFVKAERDESQIHYFITDLFPLCSHDSNDQNSDGVQYLSNMLRLHIDIPTPTFSVKIHSFLGIGATSVVYEITDPNDPSSKIAMKLCTSIDRMVVEKEKKILRTLHSKLSSESKKHIPKIVSEGDENTLLMPKYTQLIINKLIPIPFNKLACIVDLLKDVHDAGFFHKDIRPENIVQTTEVDYDLVLLDWGFAEEKSEHYNVSYFQGTVSFCAQDYAKAFIEKHPIPYQKKFDMECLLKCCFYIYDEELRKLFNESSKDNINLVDKLKIYMEIWKDYAESNTIFRTALQNLSYDSIKQALESLQQQQH